MDLKLKNNDILCKFKKIARDEFMKNFILNCEKYCSKKMCKIL